MVVHPQVFWNAFAQFAVQSQHVTHTRKQIQTARQTKLNAKAKAKANANTTANANGIANANASANTLLVFDVGELGTIYATFSAPALPDQESIAAGCFDVDEVTGTYGLGWSGKTKKRN